MSIFGFESVSTRSDSGSRIKITTPAEDPPEFVRVYESNVSTSRDTYRVKVTRYTSRWKERDTRLGELTQSNGKWVLFDPEHVADKIIDRELTPLVQRLCEDMLRMDREFMASKPGEFKDSRGGVWRKA